MFWARGEEVQRPAARLLGRDPPRRAASRASPPAGPSSISRRQMTGISNGVAPSILNASYTFTAEVTVPDGGGDGMIITQGGRFAGYGFYLNKGKPTFVWNLVGLKHVTWEAPDALTAGQAHARLRLQV